MVHGDGVCFSASSSCLFPTKALKLGKCARRGVFFRLGALKKGRLFFFVLRSEFSYFKIDAGQAVGWEVGIVQTVRGSMT